MYNELWKKIDHESKQQIRKAKANKKSDTVYNNISRDYELQMACRSCFVENVYNERNHQCENSKLLVRIKKSEQKWNLVRNVPKGFQIDHKICESMVQTSQCPQANKCESAHSRLEGEVWQIVNMNNWYVGRLLDDMRDSDLRLKYLMDKISHRILMLLACAKCFREEKFDSCTKAKRKPTCKNEHKWEARNQILALVFGKDDDKKYVRFSTKTDLTELNLPDDIIPSMTALQRCLREDDITLYDFIQIYMESRRKLHQRARRSHTNGAASATFSSFGYQSTLVDNIEDCDDVFDDKFDDILTGADIDSSEVEHRFMEEYLKSKNPMHLYYELTPHEELETLLEDTEKYRLCSIKLDGSQKARCTTIDSALEEKYEIRYLQFINLLVLLYFVNSSNKISSECVLIIFISKSISFFAIQSFSKSIMLDVYLYCLF